MDFSVALTLVQTLLQLLNSSTPLWRGIESVRGYKNQLKKLEKTISTIQNVLLDAEQQQLQLNNTQQGILKRLNEVLYEVDDLLDEIATLVNRKKFMSGNVVYKELTIFFSRFNQFKYAFTKSREIRKFRESLDDIAKDHSLFGSIVPQLGGGRTSRIYGNPRETGSLLNEEDVIIGRDDDKRVVIDMLIGPPVEERVCCVSIVGIGGLGKTTLAQLVYNDQRITREFEIKMWLCVSNDFDVKALLAEILAAVTKKPKEDLSMDRLQTRIQEELDGKKYLLVLDDIWDDVTSKWDRLKTPLIGGRRASRILISTRSRVVANIVGGQKHELKGLSEAESWKLFETMTLLSRQEMEALNGEKILKKCANVPLAIRVIGSYLRGRGQSKWKHMVNIDLAANDESIEDIVSLLKISYYDLPFQLKRCFSYCAIFPKDYEIIKEDLISLWMAQGFIQKKGQSLEDVGEEYFMNLLHRCFFQDIKCGDDGEIISCKMHDLIHDVAKSLVGTEMMLVKNNTSNLNAEVYHVFSESEDAIMFLVQMKRMRTLLRKPRQFYDFVSNIEIPKVESLRVLSWPKNGIEKVSNMIGELIHLRYLDLSGNYFRFLPSSITNLFNLQILKLRNCLYLERLPKDLRKLVNLRVLDLYDCDKLINMPSGMRSMTYLHKLTYFVLGNPTYDSTKVLEDLKCLKSLTSLLINTRWDWTCDVAEVRKGRYLSELEQLKEIVMQFQYNEEINNNKAQALLDGLQPNHNLRKVYLLGCPEVRLPSWWGRGALSKIPKSCLPELVEIHLHKCSVLELFPSMSQLPKLRVLRLEHLYNIEYIESNNNGDVGPIKLGGSLPGEAHEELVFFPSLEILKLEDLPNLKGWGLLHSNSFVFPHLKSLTIDCCVELASLPLCPQGGSFRIFHLPLLTSLSFRESMNHSSKDYRVDINSVNVGYIINSLPIDIFEHLSHLEINNWNEIKRLKPVEFSELIQSGRVSSLLSLTIYNCEELRSLSELEEMWEHLIALETLIFQDIANSKLEWEDDGDCYSGSGEHKNVEGEMREEDNGDSISSFDKPWTFLAATLRSLTLERLPKLVRLPRGMQCLTSLYSMEINMCYNLEELPAWIGCFTSLKSLRIFGCIKLKSVPQEMCQFTSLERLSLTYNSNELQVRCQKPSGADWPKIQHIPFIEFFYAS